jgi:hypothetical protein
VPTSEPLLRLLLSQPGLLAEHASAYGALLAEEGGRWIAPWQRRWQLRLLGSLALLVAVLLAGQAVLLWALLKPEQAQTLAVLAAVPLLPLLLALAAFWQAGRVRRPVNEAPPWSSLRGELAVDWALWRASAAASPSPPATPESR